MSFFFNHPRPTGSYTLSLHDALPISVTASHGYTVYAEFENIGGLKVRAPVKSSGVVVGRVDSIILDQKKYVAKRSEEHTSELQSLTNLVCRLLLEKKNATWM